MKKHCFWIFSLCLIVINMSMTWLQCFQICFLVLWIPNLQLWKLSNANDHNNNSSTSKNSMLIIVSLHVSTVGNPRYISLDTSLRPGAYYPKQGIIWKNGVIVRMIIIVVEGLMVACSIQTIKALEIICRTMEWQGLPVSGSVFLWSFNG